jgi:branched-chain amino acid transport system substrate-binding protein
MTADPPEHLVRAVRDSEERWRSRTTADGARANAFSSVRPTPIGKENPWASSGRVTNGEEPEPSIIVEPPATPAVRDRIAGFDPVRVGYLVDIDSGTLLGDCLDAVVLAAEDALNDGELFRPIEIVSKIARGLPRQAAQRTIDGYEELARSGCLAIIGPAITDNALALLPATQKWHVPLMSQNGAKAYHSYYGFTIGNGGVSEEGPVMAGWHRTKGHRRVGAVTENSPGGEEYSKAFRDGAVRNGVEIVGEVFIEQNGAGLAEGLRLLRDTAKPDALTYNGYGYPTALFNPILKELGWDPPRIMSTALMWYINEPRMLEDLEGWHGVDQVGPIDESEGTPNPNHMALVDRFERRFGRRVFHAMIPCSYDGARAVFAGISKAPLLTPDGVVLGLERLTMMPACVGGPRTYVSFGPYDRKGPKGDWLTIRKVVDGRLRFDGYIDAQYPATYAPR